jgi:hypothetical protein
MSCLVVVVGEEKKAEGKWAAKKWASGRVGCELKL